VGVEGSVTDFGLFLICGMIPFNAVAGAIRASSRVYLEQAHFLRRIPMPPGVLPTAQVVTSFLESAIAMLLFFGLLAVAGRPPGLLAPGFLLLVPMQLAMALGIGVAIASLTVMVRDIGSLTEPLLTIWFLGTPVFYPREMVPAMLLEVINANPMTPLVEGYRAFVLYNKLPPYPDVIYLTLVSAFFLAMGSWVYRQTRSRIIDYV
jgi:lipopolysaccharide transport system permease protein